MKQTLLHAVIACLAVVLSFSSCLGDSGNYYETGGSLVYIGRTGDTYQQYALSRDFGQGITSDYVKTLEVGRIYNLAFKVKFGTGGIILADYTNPVGDGTPLSRGRSATHVSLGSDPYLPGKEVFPTKKPDVLFFMPYNVDQANDIWAFGFTCQGFDEDFLKDDSGNYVNIDFYAYIEEDKQNLPVEGGASKPLDKNQAIVNLYMVRKDSAPAIDDSKKKTQSKEFTIDMSQLRSYFERRVEHEAGSYVSPVAIQFRFTTEDSAGKKTEDSIGQIDISSAVNYFMYIDNPNKPS